MKDIVRTSSGAVWREVETVEEAMAIGHTSKTAFGVYYEQERQRGARNRYIALGDDCRVIGCVPLTPPPYEGRPAAGLPLFVAYMNGDPFPTYAQDIAELAQAIGAHITRDHYPYRRQAVEDSSDPEETIPPPGR